MNLCISCLNPTDSITEGSIDGMRGILCDDCAFWMDGNLEPHEREQRQNVWNLAQSTWSTKELVSFTRFWFDYHNGSKPVWTYVALSEDEAMALLDSYDSEAEVRDICANALVHAGWTLGSINRRKS